ncbi:MAG: hypothetical protein DRQ44_13450 [Gammaproteobacteria bacterium]|nr:MAG: hypothetical protein DRQ44_13450 [Gammaproteobacteria bacterium]
MPIFNNKVVQKHLDNISVIPDDDLNIICSWVEQINNGSLAKQTEVAIHAPFTHQIMVKLLGYAPFGETDQWTISREYGVAASMTIDERETHQELQKAAFNKSSKPVKKGSNQRKSSVTVFDLKRNAELLKNN